MKSGDNKKFYHYSIKENKDLGFMAVVLADDTHIVIHKHKIGIGFPKKKFNKLFKEQIKDRKKTYLWVEFSEIELQAIMEGVNILVKNNKKRRRDN